MFYFRKLLICNIHVVDLLRAHGLQRQSVFLLQLTQSEKASQELSAAAGERVRRVLLHPAVDRTLGIQNNHDNQDNIK